MYIMGYRSLIGATGAQLGMIWFDDIFTDSGIANGHIGMDISEKMVLEFEI